MLEEVHRCRTLVAQLDSEQGWGLSPQEQRRYAQQLAALHSNLAEISDTQLSITIRYYHTEHALVEGLRDRDHPEHAAQWEELTRNALRILASHAVGSYIMAESLMSLEDLAQEAMADLWRGLPSFRYHSRFHTWAYTVISNCLARHYRALQTQKRQALPQANSLDVLLTSGDTIHDQAASLDEVAQGQVLLASLLQTLAQHPDRRLKLIFRMWAYEERTLRSIGEELSLSVARVHALLAQALTLLRNESSIRDWLEIDSAAPPRPPQNPPGLGAWISPC